jgi:hypothetical protein
MPNEHPVLVAYPVALFDPKAINTYHTLILDFQFFPLPAASAKAAAANAFEPIESTSPKRPSNTARTNAQIGKAQLSKRPRCSDRW